MRIHILFLFSLLFLISCNSIEDLSMKGQPEVRFKGLNKGEIELDLMVQITNPNSQSFKVKDASFDIYVNDQKMGQSKMVESIKIEGNSTKEYAFPMSVKLNGEDLSLSLVLNTLFQKRIKLKIDGSIKAGNFFINQRFPVEWEDNVNL
jgi:LEA14-like dessication related protein